ncbi:MAG: DUF4926 domain-containing protein [Geminicoccaceae bacterium]|nr:MAG: DUF4926 domain-containing protein [Geminicoccaceae bacterium]
MPKTPELLDVVALTEDTPDQTLVAGQVGTVVELLDDTTTLVEFTTDNGEPYALAPFPKTKLLVLQYEPPARTVTALGASLSSTNAPSAPRRGIAVASW